jgi:hypothetical protein
MEATLFCCVRLNKYSLLNNKHKGVTSIKFKLIDKKLLGHPRSEVVKEVKTHTGVFSV